jgi:CheY-like chemotaxis protein/anti-sigma regulatory factor (Ser/Thr protein kinase)
MIGMLSLLEKTGLEERQREYLQHSKVSAENLNTLVSDLLDFERIEAGELRFTRETFSLSETARYIRRLFEEAVREKGLAFEYELELGDAADLVIGDRSRVVQVLTNLVSNAVKYTREGRVALHVGAGDGGYRFEVADTGIGIAAEDAATVFNRFTQLDSGYAKAVRGVGLGLAIVKQVVEAMGGRIIMESEPGEGSTFEVLLPLEPASPAGAEVAAPEAARSGAGDPAPEFAASRPGGGRILVCEDEAINRMYLQGHLEGLGYTVETAADGEEAVQRATADGASFDLILMDLSMPRMNGLEATREIRAAESAGGGSRIPIAALTAHTYEEDISRCREAGMDDFLSKPIEERELDSLLDRIAR